MSRGPGVSAEQLALEIPKRPFVFIVHCAECGPIATVPVDGDRWGEAEKFSYVAHRFHLRDVHGKAAAA